jgi:hypothetical protein
VNDALLRRNLSGIVEIIAIIGLGVDVVLFGWVLATS